MEKEFSAGGHSANEFCWKGWRRTSGSSLGAAPQIADILSAGAGEGKCTPRVLIIVFRWTWLNAAGDVAERLKVLGGSCYLTTI